MTTLSPTDANSGSLAQQVEMAVTFLTTLFAPTDLVLFRPTESWTENGKKQSKVDYKGTCYVRATREALTQAVQRLIMRSETNRNNVFFGVNSRRGDRGRFDRAWHIGVVRVLWADLDHTTVDEALERCKRAGVPEPSIVVNSGNGVHLYWLLDEPYVIDDGPDPPPVETEWNTPANGGKRKPKKHVAVDGVGVDLAQYEKQDRLTRKAKRLQQIVSGIASKIGGDSTTDLPRLLRVPGTLNRKNERNGEPPKPAVLVSCDPERRYPIDAFIGFAEPRPAQSHDLASLMPLPKARPLGPRRADKLNDLIAICRLAPSGTRSEPDYALCCFAIKHGMRKERLWELVCDVGKFAERGREYFDRTWNKAEGEHRQKKLEAIEDRLTKAADHGQQVQADGAASGPLVDAQLLFDDDQEAAAVRLAQKITSTDHFARDAGGKLYRYVDGVYKPDGDQFVRQRVKQLTDRGYFGIKWSSHVAEEVIKYIVVDAAELWDCPPTEVINVKNGLLHTATGELHPHDPRHLSCVQIPVDYDPEADCPNVRRFVEQVFPADASDVAWEMAGILMVPGLQQDKAFLLIGSGRNGKSTWLRLLRTFLGPKNTCSISLQKLEADRFAPSRLHGKLANICPDLPSKHLSDTAVFKAITGSDTIVGEYKFKDSFDFDPFARLVFSANQLPQTKDPSEGFFHRFVVIPFDRTFVGKSKIPKSVLDASLADPRELSGLLNVALAGLRRVVEQDGYSQPASIVSACNEFRATTDPLAIWLDSNTILSPSSVAPISHLLRAFNQSQTSAGASPMTGQAFGMAITRLRPGLPKKQRTFAGKLQLCLIGLGLAAVDSSRASRASRASSNLSPPENAAPEGRQEGQHEPAVLARLSKKKLVKPVKQVKEVDSAPVLDAVLAEWFAALTPGDLPAPPFRVVPGATVTDPTTWLTAWQQDLANHERLSNVRRTDLSRAMAALQKLMSGANTDSLDRQPVGSP